MGGKWLHQTRVLVCFNPRELGSQRTRPAQSTYKSHRTLTQALLGLDASGEEVMGCVPTPLAQHSGRAQHAQQLSDCKDQGHRDDLCYYLQILHSLSCAMLRVALVGGVGQAALRVSGSLSAAAKRDSGSRFL